MLEVNNDNFKTLLHGVFAKNLDTQQWTWTHQEPAATVLGCVPVADLWLYSPVHYSPFKDIRSMCT